MSYRTRIAILIVVVLLITGLIFISGCSKRGTSTTSPAVQTTYSSPLNLSSPAMPLPQVKVAATYERVSDGVAFGRSMDEVVTIFNETNTDLIFRGFFRWQPVPESPGASLSGYSSSYVNAKADIGYTWMQLGDAIRQIKAARPNTIFVGAIATQRLNTIEINEETGETFTQSQTWDMAFDPAKYNMGMSKEDLQCQVAKRLSWISPSTSCPSGYIPEKQQAYFPDITNKQYQDLLVSHAEKQIDLGADAIWIDLFFTQAEYFEQTSKNPDDPAKKAAFDASSSVIDKIHEYGEIKYGKHIYVGTWWTFSNISYIPAKEPAVDFVTATVGGNEIQHGFDGSKWNMIKSTTYGKLGHIPIIAFVDWQAEGAPIDVFSQKLTTEQQNAWLESADAFFTREGIIFSYPVHGGTFPPNSPKLSFGKFAVYDSLAPEFNNYGTIKRLAEKKSAN
jgi:hypothetical protein